MTQPKITTLRPIVLEDHRRVVLDMVVENLPTTTSNVTLTMPTGDIEDAPSSPYPNVVLSLLDSQGVEVATVLIVEHQEPHSQLTLHLRQPQLDETYTARAEMLWGDEVLEVVEVPFTLQ